MNKYICEKCGVEILSVGKKRVILCEKCYNRQKQEEYNKLYKKPIKTKRKPRGDFRSIRQVIAEMEEHNRKHGICLTYGTYVDMMHRGNLK